MPYTPPSHRSPASSASASPTTSRRSSLQSGARPSLPRSASYLSKHRRTPSITGISDGSVASLTPQGTSEDLPSMATCAAVRQSPPPRTDDNGMPRGAVISPPESASSGSDDEATLEIRGRKLETLADLRNAVSQISQTRTPSPPRVDQKADQSPSSSSSLRPAPRGMHLSFSTSALGDMHNRKVSHVRSATEPNAPIVQSADNSMTASDEDTDDEGKSKPPMVRKKSGELVRPALRPSSHRRPSSMPGTPIFSKAVHFDSHLEHVRHFLQVDRPLAVSAGSSPVDNYESDTEYPFPCGSAGNGNSAQRTPPFEWEILTPNFSQDSLARKSLAVKLEKVWLSSDQKTMLGSVAVANLAFQKQVTCRFTLDYWKTTSEVAGEYCHEIRPSDTSVSYDRFNFSIKLADTAHLESKTLFFCIRYSVNGQEFWDNNSSANFQVDFRKKHLPQNGKNNFQGANGRPRNSLPRSNRRPNSSSSLRPKSMPVAFQDFAEESQYKFDQPIHEYLGESGPTGLRLKTKSSSNIASDNIVKGLSSPSGAAFSNRYDFGASLSAAVQAAKDTMGKDKDALYMKETTRQFQPQPQPQSSKGKLSPPAQHAAATSSGSNSPVPSLQSASYEELVNKYCFFGTKAPSPPSERQMKGGRFDGTTGEETPALVPATKVGQTSNDSSPSGSPNYIPVSGGSIPGVTGQSVAPMAAGGSEDEHRQSQHIVPERFAWRGDSYTTPAIRG